MHHIIRFAAHDKGATAIEYAFIASLIAMAIVGALMTLGPALSNAFSRVQSSL